MRPNFVFILADDLGYADLGCYGGRYACSPNIDGIARDGVLYTEGYANSSVCSPTRFALATGRWQHRVRGGADEPLHPADPNAGLPPEHPTLASLLRDAGYATALVGKWHLGHPPNFGPLKSGYEQFFGCHGGAVDYFRHASGPTHDLWDGDDEVFLDGYLTDLLTDRAVAFIAERRDKPFLLSMHYNAPHWPWETRADREEANRIRRLSHFDGGSIETYFTMIRQMDEGVGRILQAIEAAGARDNTIVVFTSDNGGERFSDMWPLVGKKMDLLEGGIRVPHVVRWPAKLPCGERRDELVITMDWTATFLAAAGVDPHAGYPLDGVDLFAHGGPRSLFWRMKFRDQKAVRNGAWKYLSIDGDEFLFDLSADSRERANMRLREPARFDALRAEYVAWETTIPAIPDDANVGPLVRSSDLASPS
jgi:arylsulfatase A-like enzyme